VIFLPYMMGERSPLWHTNARGVFFGLSLATRKRTHALHSGGRRLRPSPQREWPRGRPESARCEAWADAAAAICGTRSRRTCWECGAAAAHLGGLSVRRRYPGGMGAGAFPTCGILLEMVKLVRRFERTKPITRSIRASTGVSGHLRHLKTFRSPAASPVNLLQQLMVRSTSPAASCFDTPEPRHDPASSSINGPVTSPAGPSGSPQDQVVEVHHPLVARHEFDLPAE